MTELSVSVSGGDGEGASRILVELSGEADATTRVLAETLGAQVAKKPRLLLVDVSGLTFIDSAALHDLVLAYQKLHADGGLLALIAPSPAVARVLELTALDQLIPVYASAAEADTEAR